MPLRTHAQTYVNMCLILCTSGITHLCSAQTCSFGFPRPSGEEKTESVEEEETTEQHKTAEEEKEQPSLGPTVQPTVSDTWNQEAEGGWRLLPGTSCHQCKTLTHSTVLLNIHFVPVMLCVR
eukprot:GHVS01068625.1.p3 GENE.GHVS01068625.1~~GHVS01068625.1.p3  ORF type:complete len:122 (+),score=20.86 GHVS01068625.1:1544-1909(+)